MTIRKLTREQVLVRDQLIENQSVPAVAKILRMKERRVRTIADQLVFLNQLRRNPTSKYPITYISPLPIPKGIGTQDLGNCGGSVDPRRGDASPKRDPEQSRVHLNGQIYYKVRNAGTRLHIRNRKGTEVGVWYKSGEQTGHPQGSKEFSGFVRIETQDIEFFYREGNKGSRTLSVYPGYAYATAPGAMAKGEAILRDRAAYILELLGLQGWTFCEQEVRGTFESGHENHPFMGRMDRGHVNSDAQVKIDTSPKIPEVEVSDEEANDILSFAPEHIKQLYDDGSDIRAELDSKIAKLEREQKYLQIRTLEKENFLLERHSTLLDLLRRQAEIDELRKKKSLLEGEAMYG